MNKIALILLLLTSSIMARSQTITVKDSETGRPVELATIVSESMKAYTSTNAYGQADITIFYGAEKIVIRSLGYKTVTRSYDELQSAGMVVIMEQSNMNLEEVVVSATRWRQNSSDVPSKISSISIRDITLQNPQTAADLLNITGKIYIQKSQQGGGSPMIRGFATNRLLYTVDGIRMNTAIFRSGNIQNVINLDPFATENAEVIFGPGSVIYGSDAIGGVMSFQTITPQLSLSDKPSITGKAVARTSSANKEATGHFDLNIGWRKWAIVTSFSSWDYDHLRQGSHGPDDYLKDYYVQRQDDQDVVINQDDPLLQVPSAYSQINLMQKIRFQPNEKWDFQYGFHYSETSPYGRYDRHLRVKNGTARYAEWNYGPQKWMMNNLTITQNDDNAIYDQLTLRLAWQSFEESRIDRSLNNNERNTQTEEVEAYSANLDFNKQTGTRNTLFYGFEYIFNDVNSTGLLTDISSGTEEAGPSRYPLSTWSSLAAYVNDDYRISEKFTFQAGLRYNQFNLDADFSNNLDFYPFPFSTANINDGALTGSIGGVFRPNDKLVLNGNIGTAFRSPNIDDLGKVFDSESGSVTVPNPDLEAEYAYNFDLGLARVFGDVVKIDLTGYYTVLKNAMVRRDYQLNGEDSIMYDGEMSKVQAIQNAAVANVFGLQAGIEIKFPAGFSFSTDLNYQIGEEELDDGTISPSRHAAPFFGTSRLSFNTGRLSLQLNTIYQAEKPFDKLPQEEQGKTEIYAKDSDGNPYSPSWYTINLKASYGLTDTFVLGAGVENITDQRYRPYSSGISAPGRNFILSLRANF